MCASAVGFMAFSPAIVAEWHSDLPTAKTYDLFGYAPNQVKERLQQSPAKNREISRMDEVTSFKFDLEFTDDCVDGRLRVCSHGDTTIILAIGEDDYWKKMHKYKFVIRQRIDPVGKRDVTDCSIPSTQCPTSSESGAVTASTDTTPRSGAVLIAGAIGGIAAVLAIAIGLGWRQCSRSPSPGLCLSRLGPAEPTNSRESGTAIQQNNMMTQ